MPRRVSRDPQALTERPRLHQNRKAGRPWAASSPASPTRSASRAASSGQAPSSASGARPERGRGSPAQRILRGPFSTSPAVRARWSTTASSYARPRVPRQDRVDLRHAHARDQATGFLDGEMKRLGAVMRSRDTEGSLFVLGDKDLLYRAVYNILVNAYQAIGTAGTMHIRGERREGRSRRDTPLSFPRQRPRFPARPAAQAS